MKGNSKNERKIYKKRIIDYPKKGGKILDKKDNSKIQKNQQNKAKNPITIQEPQISSKIDNKNISTENSYKSGIPDSTQEETKRLQNICTKTQTKYIPYSTILRIEEKSYPDLSHKVLGEK